MGGGGVGAHEKIIKTGGGIVFFLWGFPEMLIFYSSNNILQEALHRNIVGVY